MLDYIDDWTIQTIEILNFLILLFWFGSIISNYMSNSINQIFSLRKKRNGKN